MSTQVLTNVKTWLGEYQLSDEMNACALAYAAEAVDDTVFGDTSRSRAGGLKTIVAQLAGYVNMGSGLGDEVMHGKIGVVDVPISIVPSVGAEGDRAYAFLALVGEYSPDGEIGAMHKFSARAEGCGSPLVRGFVGHNGTVSTDDVTTGFQVGAVGTGQRLYAALHVLSAAGTTPTLDVTIESDADDTFASALEQIAFTQVSDVGSEWKSVAGAITDTYYRVTFTLGGTTPSFRFAVVLGVA